jgi:hypothetical protein
MEGRLNKMRNGSTPPEAPTGGRLKLMTETLGRFTDAASDRMDAVMDALANLEEMVEEIRTDVRYTGDRISDLSFRMDRVERALERLPK